MTKMKKALIVWGGWDGHQPKEVAEIFRGGLEQEGFEVEVSDTLEAFADGEKLKALDLIVPVWTMGRIRQECGEQCFGSGAKRRRAWRLPRRDVRRVPREHRWQFMTGGNGSRIRATTARNIR